MNSYRSETRKQIKLVYANSIDWKLSSSVLSYAKPEMRRLDNEIGTKN